MPALFNKNLDTKNVVTDELKQEFNNALESGDAEKVSEVFINMAQNIQTTIINEAEELMHNHNNDSAVLAQRGITPLTNKEKAYYNAVIDAEGFAGVEQMLPATVVDRVFDELEQTNELLDAIDFVNTTGVTKWIIKKGEVNPAFWGKLTDAIRKKLDDGFELINTDLYKLSAYLPVAKAMLALGPEWLDKYVRTVLTQASAIACEAAIVNGTGKDEPIGVLRNLAGSVVEGVYPEKSAVAITDLTPKTLGEKVMYPLTKNGTRKVTNVLIIVNPADYWSKIFPATTVLTANGTYAHGVLPIPAKIIQSVSMPIGKMAAGVSKDYFLGVGSNQKIEYSDDVKFIEDERVYATKMYANGRPSSNDSFQVFDISAVTVGVDTV